MRKVEFDLETDTNGKMYFRTIKAFGIDKWNNDIWEVEDLLIVGFWIHELGIKSKDLEIIGNIYEN